MRRARVRVASFWKLTTGTDRERRRGGRYNRDGRMQRLTGEASDVIEMVGGRGQEGGQVSDSLI